MRKVESSGFHTKTKPVGIAAVAHSWNQLESKAHTLLPYQVGPHSPAVSRETAPVEFSGVRGSEMARRAKMRG